MNEVQAEERWRRAPNETAEAYVERVGGWDSSPMRMIQVLRDDFGISVWDARDLAIASRSFQTRYLRDGLTALHARGGARYAAMNWVRRRSDFSASEATQLVDSIGEWSR